MRFPIENGNGHKCDICERILRANENIQVEAKVTTDSTGRNKVCGRIDLCRDCYYAILGEYIQAPRVSCKTKRYKAIQADFNTLRV